MVLASEPVGGRSRATELPCCTLWPIYEKLAVIFFPYIFPIFFSHILGLSFKISYQIVSLFDMYIDMGERIAGKQDRPSLIIEDLLRVP